MIQRRRVALAASLVVTLTIGPVACSNDHSDGSSKDRRYSSLFGAIGGSPERGGTLTVLSDQDFAHLDPARNWIMPNMDFGVRLLYRTLTTFKAEPGRRGSEVVPDLATDLGRPSEGGRVWTFTLKEGLKYEDGSTVTAQDVKYNVERSFAPELTGGPDYARQYLADAGDYRGPLGGEHLKSIETPDDRTIVFRLRRPVAEFSYTATLPTFSPVPQSEEKGVRYDLRPFSSGPYKIDSYDRGKRMVLVRNTHWDSATDTVRKAYPDRIVVRMGLKGEEIDDRLIADREGDASAVEWSDMYPESVDRVLADPEVKARLAAELTGCTDMLHLNTSRAPFDDPGVRAAVQYAVDKVGQAESNGGLALNEIATSYLPPELAGGEANDVLGAGPRGDVGKARKLLARSGRSGGFEASLAVSANDEARAVALRKSLGRVGISVRIETVDPSVYYDTVGDTAKAPDMSLSGWCPDYPSGATFLPFIFDGRTIKKKGNQGNFAQFRDKEVMKRMDVIADMPDAAEANQAWIELDALIMTKAPSVPLLWERKPLLVGSNIAGAFGHPVWSGQFDYAVIGLKDPDRTAGRGAATP